MKEHKSDPHNPLIAGAFFRTGDIEAWGRGIDTIRDACREHGSNFPTFESEPTSMMVEFKGKIPEATATHEPSGKNQERVGETPRMEGDEGSTTQENTQETRGKCSVKSSVKSSVKGSVKSSVKILDFLRQDKYMTIPQLAEQLGITTRAIEKNIKNLQESGQLVRVGPDKGGHWEILEGQHE